MSSLHYSFPSLLLHLFIYLSFLVRLSLLFLILLHLSFPQRFSFLFVRLTFYESGETVAKTKEVERELSMTLGAGERRKYPRVASRLAVVRRRSPSRHRRFTKEPHVVRVARGSRDKFPVVPTRVLRCVSACRPRYSVPKGNRVAAPNRSFISADNPSRRCSSANSVV